MATTQEKIQIILNEEKRAYTARGRSMGRLGSFNHGIPSQGPTSEERYPELVVAQSDPNAIKSTNVDLLLKLYSSLDSTEKVALEVFLLVEMRSGGNYEQVSYFIFFALYRIGQLRQAIEAAANILGTSISFDNVAAMLALIVKYEYSFLSEEEYRLVEAYWGNTNSYRNWLRDRINAAKFKILERQLNDVNPEINADKEKLVSLWEARFGKGPITGLIKEIDEFFNEGEFSQTRYATCIGRVRVLLVEVFRGIGTEISSKSGDGKIAGASDEHAVLDYLRNCKFLTDHEWNLARSLYGIASDHGAHRLVALREQARIAKNVAYEVALLAVTKFNDMKGD
jgi:hypothetical protein